MNTEPCPPREPKTSSLERKTLSHAMNIAGSPARLDRAKAAKKAAAQKAKPKESATTLQQRREK